MTKFAAEKYRDAAIKEVKDNAKDEKDAKEKEKDHYEKKAKEQEKDIDDKLEKYDEEDAKRKPVMATGKYGMTTQEQNNFLIGYHAASAARSTAQSNLLAAAGSAKAENTATVNAKSSREPKRLS